MAEAVLNWTDIFNAIQADLEAVTNSAGAPAFEIVIPGEPIGLPVGGPYCCFWYRGRIPATKAGGARATFGNVMYAARIQVAAYWQRQNERSTVGTLEADIATIDTNMRRAFRANSTINNNLTDLDITDSEVDFGGFPLSGNQALYRYLMFELRLDNLEGEAIAP